MFDKQTVQSIGAVSIDPTNPKVVWVGSGESWMRNSVSIGDGIYKSTDGGENWTNMGLRESEHIAKILIDPGFGFGKNVGHNLELMNGLALFHSLGCPLVIGASRKRTIGALSGEAPADQRLGGSIAFAMKALEQGAQLLRVHDVVETVQALRVWRGLRDQALTPRV